MDGGFFRGARHTVFCPRRAHVLPELAVFRNRAAGGGDDDGPAHNCLARTARLVDELPCRLPLHRHAGGGVHQQHDGGGADVLQPGRAGIGAGEVPAGVSCGEPDRPAGGGPQLCDDGDPVHPVRRRVRRIWLVFVHRAGATDFLSALAAQKRAALRGARGPRRGHVPTRSTSGRCTISSIRTRMRWGASTRTAARG